MDGISDKAKIDNIMPPWLHIFSLEDFVFILIVPAKILINKKRGMIITKINGNALINIKLLIIKLINIKYKKFIGLKKFFNISHPFLYYIILLSSSQK